MRMRLQPRRHAASLYGDRPTLVYDLASGPAKPIARLPSLGGGNGFAVFDRTGEMVYETETDGTLRRWDPNTGEALATWPAVGSGRPSVAADGRTVLVSDLLSPTAVLLDSGVRGDLGQVQTCGGFVSAGSLHIRNRLAAFLEFCGSQGFTQVIDLPTQELLKSMPGWSAQDLALSPDGRSVVTEQFTAPATYGPLIVADLRTEPWASSSRVCAGGTSRWRPRPTGSRAAQPSRRLHSRSGHRASSGRPTAR